MEAVVLTFAIATVVGKIFILALYYQPGTWEITCHARQRQNQCVSYRQGDPSRKSNGYFGSNSKEHRRKKEIFLGHTLSALAHANSFCFFYGLRTFVALVVNLTCNVFANSQFRLCPRYGGSSDACEPPRPQSVDFGTAPNCCSRGINRAFQYLCRNAGRGFWDELDTPQIWNVPGKSSTEYEHFRPNFRKANSPSPPCKQEIIPREMSMMLGLVVMAGMRHTGVTTGSPVL